MTRSKGAEPTETSGRGAEILALALLGLTAFFFISLYSEYLVASEPYETARNAGGAVGAWIASLFISYLGLFGSYALLGVFTTWALLSFFGVKIVGWPWRVMGALLVVLSIAALDYTLSDGQPFFSIDYEPAADREYVSGGYFGNELGWRLYRGFGHTGTYLVTIFAILVGIVLVADVRVSPLVRLFFWRSGEAAVQVGRRFPTWAQGIVTWFDARLADWRERRLERASAGTATRGKTSSQGGPTKKSASTGGTRKQESKKADETTAKKSTSARSTRAKADGAAQTAAAAAGEVGEKPKRGTKKKADEEELDEAKESEDVHAWSDDEEDEEGGWEEGSGDDEEWEEDDEWDEDTDDEEWEEDDDDEWEDDSEREWPDDSDEDELSADDEAKPKAPRKIVLSSAPAEVVMDSTRFEETQLSLDGVYSFPPIEFLSDPTPVDHEEGREELEEVAKKIEDTLASFKIEAEVVEVQRGPVITQYEVALAAGIKVHKIVSLSDDLAMALSARSIRVVAPIPGKSAVGIEVPNRKREMVCLKELLLSKKFSEVDYQIPLMIGKDVSGEPIIEDLAAMPHLLIAGSTGSGKSVCINAIISSMLMTRSPQELKLILVDPKMVELSSFEDIPHLLTPVITDMKKAPAALDWIVRKMDQRYALLANAEVRHITSYNGLGKETIFERLAPKVGHEEAENAPVTLPYIVVIIDELADLMMTASKEVEASIIRLAQKSRAVGIHVILATQRPSVDVITGLIKSNLPCRISFMVAGRVDSRTILDRNGAEKLLGRGDMLYLGAGTSDLTRAQSTYISDKEIRKMVRFLKQETKPEFSQEIEGFLEGNVAEAAGSPGADDSMFDEAVRAVLESQRGSVSMLQRRLGVGYTRASRLMDLMAEQGIVGPFKGSKAREVYMSLEEWEAARAE